MKGQTKTKHKEKQSFFEYILTKKTTTHNPYWKSSLFNEIYLNNSIQSDYKEIWEYDEDTSPYQVFLNNFINLCIDMEDENFDGWSEADTVSKWIHPLMEFLGWHDKATRHQKPYLDNVSFTIDEDDRKKKNYRPDLLFTHLPDETSLISENRGSSNLKEAQNKTAMVLEAKYWNRLEEYKQGKVKATSSKKEISSDSTKSRTPEDQILKYITILNQNFGILTDGSTWRLYHKELSNNVNHRCYEVNIDALRKLAVEVDKGQNREELRYFAKYFYHFFSKQALYYKENDKTFVNKILEHSKKYSNEIEEDLKTRFISAMSITCNGFYNSVSKKQKDPDLNKIRDISESHIFNILFIKSLEARGILPLKAPDYYKLSLTELIDELYYTNYDPEINEKLNFHYLEPIFKTFCKSKPEGYHIYNRLIELYQNIYDGKFGFQAKGFKESVFSKDEWNFAQKYKLDNFTMLKLLFELGFTETEDKEKKYQQIPYSYFTPRQLGSIYESFLEYKLDLAKTNMVYFKKQWKEVKKLDSKKGKNLNIPKVKKGELFFSPNNKERKDTGSYYTPDYIVQYIVKETIGPLCENKSSKEILKLKICDPAMGSGHFLSGALDFLTDAFIQAKEKEEYDDLEIFLPEVKRKVLHNCIFGVDINPRAVKLAKMSLWLETAYAGKELEHLDDQLKCGNSLIDKEFEWNIEFKNIMKTGGFDTIIGNPPYIGEQDRKELFEIIKKDKNNTKIYQGRSDIFYYFINRGFDLLKRKGLISFITTAYWIQSNSAKLLREKLSKADIKRLIYFNNIQIFNAAKGQHSLIFIVCKNNSNKKEVEITNLESKEKEISEDDVSHVLFKSSSNYKILYNTQNRKHPVDQNWIELLGQVKNEDKSNHRFDTILGELFILNQGIVPNPDKITNRNIKNLENNNAKVGDGVFSLTIEDLCRLKLNNYEKNMLKDTISNSEIEKFYINKKKDEKLIYITKETDIKKCSNIIEHLKKYKPILESRREVAQGKIPWYSLHWPRKKEIFENIKIVMSNWGNNWRPFALDKDKYYCKRDVTILSPKIDLGDFIYALITILNSDYAKAWFKSNTNIQGYTRQNTQLDFPLPSITMLKEHQNIANKLIELGKEITESKDINFLNIKFIYINKQVDELIKATRKFDKAA